MKDTETWYEYNKTTYTKNNLHTNNYLKKTITNKYIALYSTIQQRLPPKSYCILILYLVSGNEWLILKCLTALHMTVKNNIFQVLTKIYFFFYKVVHHSLKWMNFFGFWYLINLHSSLTVLSFRYLFRHAVNITMFYFTVSEREVLLLNTHKFPQKTQKLKVKAAIGISTVDLAIE